MLIDSLNFTHLKNIPFALSILTDHLIYNSLFESIWHRNNDKINDRKISFMPILTIIVQIIPKLEFFGYNLKIKIENFIFTGK